MSLFLLGCAAGAAGVCVAGYVFFGWIAGRVGFFDRWEDVP